MSGGVAKKWLAHVEGERSTYTSRSVPAAEVLAVSRSDYVRWFTGGAPAGAKILEAGCGSGKFSFALAYLGYRVTTLDISDPVLARVAANRERLSAELGRPLDVTTVQGDVENLPFEGGTFDVTMNEGVVEHWMTREERVGVIRGMARVTKPGGRVVVFVPNGRHPFFNFWVRTGYPGYTTTDEVPWHRYGVAELGGDVSRAGLDDVRWDGVSPWGTLAVWPNSLPFRAVAALASRLLPAPLWLRRKFGFNIVAAGTVPPR